MDFEIRREDGEKMGENMREILRKGRKSHAALFRAGASFFCGRRAYRETGGGVAGVFGWLYLGNFIILV